MFYATVEPELTEKKIPSTCFDIIYILAFQTQNPPFLINQHLYIINIKYRVKSSYSFLSQLYIEASDVIAECYSNETRQT